MEEVEVVGGSVVRLPCDLSPPEDDDSVALVIWYKDDDKTPIYRYCTCRAFIIFLYFKRSINKNKKQR